MKKILFIILFLCASASFAQTRPHWLQINGAPVVDIRSLGAVSGQNCDVAFAKIASLTAPTIFVPAGTYNITKTINLPSNSTIFGEGPSSIIKHTGTEGYGPTATFIFGGVNNISGGVPPDTASSSAIGTRIAVTGQPQVGQKDIVIADLTGFDVGEMVLLEGSTMAGTTRRRFTHTDIISSIDVASSALYLRHGCGFPFPAGETVTVKNMSAAWKPIENITISRLNLQAEKDNTAFGGGPVSIGLVYNMVIEDCVMSGYYGVSSNSVFYSRIRNNNIQCSYMGVEAALHSCGNIIENNMIDYQQDEKGDVFWRASSPLPNFGIMISESGSANIVRGNVVRGKFFYGLFMTTSTSDVVENNRFENCYLSIGGDTAGARIFGNKITGYDFNSPNYSVGIALNSAGFPFEDPIIKDNLISLSLGRGIDVSNPSGNLVIRDNVVRNWASGNQIIIHSANPATYTADVSGNKSWLFDESTIHWPQDTAINASDSPQVIADFDLSAYSISKHCSGLDLDFSIFMDNSVYPLIANIVASSPATYTVLASFTYQPSVDSVAQVETKFNLSIEQSFTSRFWSVATAWSATSTSTRELSTYSDATTDPVHIKIVVYHTGPAGTVAPLAPGRATLTARNNQCVITQPGQLW